MKTNKRTIKEHILRGCKKLPHMGSHPIRDMWMLPIIIGAAFGMATHGKAAAIIWGIILMAAYTACYLYIAYANSRLDDHLHTKQNSNQGRAANT
jgi:hypothetical protein